MKKLILLSTILGFLFISGCGKDEDGLTEEQQLAADLQLIDSYLESNNIDAELHESEIRYVVEVEGTGESPASDANVIVKYEGRYLNDNVFDRNFLGVNFKINQLIEAWEIMIPEMKEGGKMTIFIPSKYGYGTRGNSLIPPNTVLVFDIELVSLVRSESEQLAIDIEKIEEYLANNDITAEVHNTGIRYQTITEGTGLSPTLDDLIVLNYSGQLLENEIIIDEGTAEPIRLNTQISALKTMVPTMKEGGKMIIYAPSGFCYGNIGDGVSIPPNANFIFEIELLSIN
ncbi:FKBP-type peptidyl-prolyl cis-trans isomerase [Ekhidna sp.]|uniref:FKBP-type peptidyl-prolyl cis-trans isomerase n=1 Tax=Ekhidna sp. TaxID=2608089 RepID=UPI003B50A5F1